MKDHHCFPITEENLKITASKANQGGCDNLLKHMSDLTWSRRHENIHQIKEIDEINSHGKEKHIIILPSEMKMPLVLNNYVAQSKYYVEYLHWNNNSILDEFIDHKNKNNMVLLNDEYVESSILMRLHYL